MKTRRFTYAALTAVAVDLLVLGGAWHAAPAMSLAASLTVPRLEPMLAPLYTEPATELIEGFDVYRAPRPKAAVILVRDTERPDAAIIALARALARRDLTVLVPHGPSDSRSEAPAIAPAIDYAGSLSIPVRIKPISTLLEDTPPSAYERAARVIDAYRIATSLLSRP